MLPVEVAVLVDNMTVSFFLATDENDEGSTIDWGVNKNQTFSFPFLLCLWCSQLLLHYREPTTVYISYNSTGQVHNCVVLSNKRKREKSEAVSHLRQTSKEPH